MGSEGLTEEIMPIMYIMLSQLPSLLKCGLLATRVKPGFELAIGLQKVAGEALSYYVDQSNEAPEDDSSSGIRKSATNVMSGQLELHVRTADAARWLLSDPRVQTKRSRPTRCTVLWPS